MGDGSVHGSLRGAAWSQWRQELGPGSVGERGSPTPVDDVMKLPREDMTTLGRWPARDSFILVTCDKCDRNVKIEAFESHVAMRHGTKSERSAYHRVTAARAAALLSCQVRLTAAGSPQHSQLLERLEARGLPASTSGSSLGSAGPASPGSSLPYHPVESSTNCSPARTPSPAPTVPVPEGMEASPSPPPAPPSPTPVHKTHKKPPYRGQDEADSTTNNVISIPESDDIRMMPNIEILSDGMDLLNTKFHFSSPAAVPSQTSSEPPSSTPSPPPHINLNLKPKPKPVEPMETDQNAPPAPTHYITVSPLSKNSTSPRKLVIGRLPAPLENKKLVTGREREYDPNRHCGVWDSEQKRNCTRSLTCKSHSVYLKRKVINRTGPFDELLAQHKAEKEAVTVRSSSALEGSFLESRLDTTSILERRLKLATTAPSGKPELARVGSSIQVLQPASLKPVNKEVGCDDSLHYTTDHPKPLAVCTFGGKRIGGLFITDRPRLFTRKVMKLAIGRSGLQPSLPRQQALPYIVNFQSGGLGLTGGHTIKLASALQPVTQQIMVQSGDFKSDLGDFKGGLKFELGGVPRQMHQIVPSGSEGAG